MRRNQLDTEMMRKNFQDFLKARNNIIVVEGKKDLLALKQLGFKRIFVLNEGGKSLFLRTEELADYACRSKKEVVILTDFDKEGRKISTILKRSLVIKGVKINTLPRTFLGKLGVSHIEGLSTFFRNKIEK